MKRKLSLIVLIAMLAVACFGVFAACKNDGLDEYALKLFVNQVEKQIANAQGKTSYTLNSILTATNVDDEEITCNVEWTADNGVTLAKGTTTIDVTVPAGVTSYILTGTLVDGKGNKYDVEGNPVMKSVSVSGGNQGGTDTPSGDKGTTQSNPYTVAEALAVINGLEQGGYSSAMVYTKGLVSDYKAGSSGQYRCSISDTASGTKLSVWYSNLGSGVTSFKNGDTIIVYGYLMRFWDNKNQKETPEITNKSDDASSTPTIVSVVDGGGSTTPGGGNQGGSGDVTGEGVINLMGNSTVKSSSASENVFESNGITVTNSKNNSNQDLTIQETYEQRFFANTTVKIDYTAPMSKIVITMDSQGNSKLTDNTQLTLNVSGATVTVVAGANGTITIEFTAPVSSVTITLAKQVRAAKIEVFTN